MPRCESVSESCLLALAEMANGEGGLAPWIVRRAVLDLAARSGLEGTHEFL
jgi:hypothetical protein